MKDIVIDENGDLSIINGDFHITETDEQNIELIVSSYQGEWKENPSLGVNLNNSKGGNIDRFLKRSIVVQLDSDGFNVDSLNIKETGIEINGQYTNK